MNDDGKAPIGSCRKQECYEMSFRKRVGPQNVCVNTGTSVLGNTKLLTSERVGKTRNWGYKSQLSTVYKRVNKVLGLQPNERASVSLSKQRNVG